MEWFGALQSQIWMFSAPLVLYGTTGGFTAAKLCILKLLLVAKYSQYLIQSWHGGRATS